MCKGNSTHVHVCQAVVVGPVSQSQSQAMTTGLRSNIPGLDLRLCCGVLVVQLVHARGGDGGVGMGSGESGYLGVDTQV